MSNIKSYETLLLEFVHEVLTNDSTINSFITSELSHISNKVALGGLNEESPPPFKNRVNLIYVGSITGISEAEARFRNTIVLLVGHDDEELIKDGNGNDIQRGKVNNADLAEVVAKVVCLRLQREFEKKSICEAQIVQDYEVYFPTFAHRITINMKFPKVSRGSVFE